MEFQGEWRRYEITRPARARMDESLPNNMVGWMCIQYKYNSDKEIFFSQWIGLGRILDELNGYV